MKKHLKKHWFIRTISISLPTIWFSMVLPFLGRTLRLVQKEKNELTTLGWWITLAVVGGIFLANLIKNILEYRCEYDEIQYLENNLNYYKNIDEYTKFICDDKLSSLRNAISEVKKNGKDAPRIVSRPNLQLKKILEKISSLMCILASKPNYKFTESDFLVTLAYNFPDENDEWKWVHETSEGSVCANELAKSEGATTFKYLLSTNKTHYFNNDKVLAKEQGKYEYNLQDTTSADAGRDIGSIFCKQYEIKCDGKTYIKAILSISTTSKKFIKEQKRKRVNKKILRTFEDNMVNLSKDIFGNRISIELCLLYLLELNEKKK